VFSGGCRKKKERNVPVEIAHAYPLPDVTLAALKASFNAHEVSPGRSLPAGIAGGIRGFARGAHGPVDAAMLDLFPNLEIVANFGVGYDGIDLKHAASRGIIVTNTPDVLTEETADTALGLLLNTVREFPAAERHLRAGKWAKEGAYRLTQSMRNRTVGIVGLGRIGKAIARRLDAMSVPVVYHGRNRQDPAPWPYYADLRAMAEAVDVLLIVIPGNAATRNLIDANILEALGANGILINVGRGTVVDEPALIAALRKGTILAAGLDVFPDEPRVTPALIDLPNAVLFPHVGSATLHTRAAMGQLMIDNLKSWFAEGRPLTPVPETPWPR
jgi:lactate dehydrogenase-like 2-hydroxyacid dehydrogenase